MRKKKWLLVRSSLCKRDDGYYYPFTNEEWIRCQHRIDAYWSISDPDTMQRFLDNLFDLESMKYWYSYDSDDLFGSSVSSGSSSVSEEYEKPNSKKEDDNDCKVEDDLD